MKINKSTPACIRNHSISNTHNQFIPSRLWSYFYCIIHHIYIDFHHIQKQNMMKVNPINALTMGERRMRIRKIKYHASIIECISYFIHCARLLLIRFSNLFFLSQSLKGMKIARDFYFIHSPKVSSVFNRNFFQGIKILIQKLRTQKILNNKFLIKF